MPLGASGYFSIEHKFSTGSHTCPKALLLSLQWQIAISSCFGADVTLRASYCTWSATHQTEHSRQSPCTSSQSNAAQSYLDGQCVLALQTQHACSHTCAHSAHTVSAMACTQQPCVIAMAACMYSMYSLLWLVHNSHTCAHSAHTVRRVRTIV